MVAHEQISPNQLSVTYQSVIVKGTIRILTDEKESKQGMEMFLEKFSPLDNSRGRQYASQAPTQNVQLYCIEIENITGKAVK